MSVKIRFSRLGKPKNSFYRIVVMDSRKPRNSEYLDKVGHMNPLVKKEDRSHHSFYLDRERIISWLQKGAQPTQVVLDLLREEKIWEEFTKQEPKRKSKKRKNRSHPISEMLKRREEKKLLEEAKKKALSNKAKRKAEDAEARKETPVEETKAANTEETKIESKEENANLSGGGTSISEENDKEDVTQEEKS